MTAPSGQAQRADDAVAIYQAGDLTIDTGRQRVLRGEQEIPLPKLSFDLLLALVRAAPNVVTLDALMAEVWPNLVVSPETVSQRVKLLREALGDDSRHPRYIASLRSRGYRFMPAVAQAAAAASLPSASASPRIGLIAFISALVILGAVGAALIYTYTMRPQATHSAATPPAISLPSHTLAVLPFQNLATEKEKDSELLAFGLAEGLLHRLASMRDLTLIARTSSFSAAAAPGADAPTIGRNLNARYLVEGSVQRSGTRLRVTAQLIDAENGAHVWSLRFDRTVDDIFAVEDEITQNVAQALQVTLAETRHPYARFGPDAYLTFLQGRALVASRKAADAQEAIERFEHVIALAPDFAAAYVDLANAYVNLAHLQVLYLSDPNRQAVERARPLVAKALQLDATLGEAYVLRGFIQSFDGDAVGAESDYRRGLELAPNYGFGYERFSEFLLVELLRFDEALAVIDRARVVDPLRPKNHYGKGRMLADVGFFKEAESLYLRALEVAPDYHPALLRLGELRAEHGQFAEAVRLGERAAAIEPAPWASFVLAGFYLDIGDPDAARAVLADQPEDLQWATVCMFEGKSDRVAAIVEPFVALEGVDPVEDEFFAFALRDAAQGPGRSAQARAVLEARWERARARPPSAEFWGTRLAYAQLQLARGNRNEAQQLARAMLQINSRYVVHGIQYAKPYAYVLLGDNDAAIRALEQNTERGHIRRWWYTFERAAPLRSALGADPRFESLGARASQHAASERALLQQMRERGEAPARRVVEAAVRRAC
ncbi:MAG TPA: winged helix-turn-helix domain-containing protein [Steroidobacteraceae bacterium]|nr:winged helix-turn-helix domain-containing protein [Steroidobacteraceae bacterium]